MLKDVDKDLPTITVVLTENHAKILEKILRNQKDSNREIIPMSWESEAMLAEEARAIGLVLDQISQGLNAL